MISPVGTGGVLGVALIGADLRFGGHGVRVLPAGRKNAGAARQLSRVCMFLLSNLACGEKRFGVKRFGFSEI